MGGTTFLQKQAALEQSAAPSHALLAWFDRHKRDLPWRRTRDPYAIWVSEIMLQQTRVAAVLDHYARWMARFPTIAALAASEQSEVLAMWSGLGYYRRARYLHRGAQAVMADHLGKLPHTAAALRTLPGIGEYTSAAIASIAFGEPVAVVDGNVERVISRLKALSPANESSPGVLPSLPPRQLSAATLVRSIRSAANDLLDPARPGDANQAVMELGATICLPKAPLCLHCPVQPWCLTRGEHAAGPRKAMQSRSICHALVLREGPSGQCEAREILLSQRPSEVSLMAGMWELPLLPSGTEKRAPLLTLRHAITTTNYQVSIVPCDERDLPQGAESRWVPIADIEQIALTGLARKTLKRLALWPRATAEEEMAHS